MRYKECEFLWIRATNNIEWAIGVEFWNGAVESAGSFRAYVYTLYNSNLYILLHHLLQYSTPVIHPTIAVCCSSPPSY